MKHLLLSGLLLLLLPCALSATTITDLYVDEYKQHLIIVGHFGSAPGTVTVDSVPLPIVSWSDTLVVCHIDSAGRASYGPVVLSEPATMSSDRAMLSWISLHLEHYWTEAQPSTYQYTEDEQWHLVLRANLLRPHSGYPDRVSTGSFSVNSHQQDQHNYSLYDNTSGSGPLATLYPESSASNGYVMEFYSGPSGLALDLQQCAVAHALTTIVTDYYGHTDSSYSQDYSLRGFLTTPEIQIKLDSNYQVVNGYLPLTDDRDLKRKEYFSWTRDTTRFAPERRVERVEPAKHPSVPEWKFIGRSIMLDPTADGRLRVYSIDGRIAASTELHAGIQVTLALPPAYYYALYNDPSGVSTVAFMVR